jgi:IS5 family transposase
LKQAALDLKLSVKKTRKPKFLEQIKRVVPWTELVALTAPYYPEGRNGRPPFAL